MPPHDETTEGQPLPYAPPVIETEEPPVAPAVAPRIVAHGSRQTKLIALTFDACGTSRPSAYDQRVVGILVDMHVPATLFLGGKWMEDLPEKTRYLASLPQFELGNHTFLHPHMTKMSDARVREELRWTQEVMYTLTGRQATLFRAPYGEVDERVARLAAEEGLITIQYDLPSGDPDPRATKDKLVEYVTTMSKKGSIVVMHINGHGWHTAEALPRIIKRMRKDGYTFVTVSDLLAAQAALEPAKH
jgi:peptidoglycan/xylan/chitin deacetylase (PgdA/CDA1 family)